MSKPSRLGTSTFMPHPERWGRDAPYVPPPCIRQQLAPRTRIFLQRWPVRRMTLTQRSSGGMCANRLSERSRPWPCDGTRMWHRTMPLGDGAQLRSRYPVRNWGSSAFGRGACARSPRPASSVCRGAGEHSRHPARYSSACAQCGKNLWEKSQRCERSRQKTNDINILYGAPDTIRTCDLCLRRATLYPAELRALSVKAG